METTDEINLRVAHQRATGPLVFTLLPSLMDVAGTLVKTVLPSKMAAKSCMFGIG